ncbi:MAG: hypothetical protein HYZ53_16615 [Planctomycetes bacterium]|nr:hypothetical protein [Planctomycetota bacterium]
MATPPGEPRTLDHAGFLEDLTETPAFLREGGETVAGGRVSCAFCGVGDSAVPQIEAAPAAPPPEALLYGTGTPTLEQAGRSAAPPAPARGPDPLEIEGPAHVATTGAAVLGRLEVEQIARTIVAQQVENRPSPQGVTAVFKLHQPTIDSTKLTLRQHVPTPGCAKLRISLGLQRPVFPIHAGPSVLDRATGRRRAISYPEAIERLADLLLAHRPTSARTLIYACGQVDYFTIFSFQEVFRLLGILNLAGNAEHCLNAGAVHNEILTGQEGPFLTLEQGFDGPGRFYLLNGWNGYISHPPAFARVMKRKDLDAYMVEVALTESAQVVAAKLGPGRVLFVRSGADPQLALAVAHEVLARYPQAVDRRFVERYADPATFEKYAALAASEAFEAEKVAGRIAPEPDLAPRLVEGIRDIAARLVRPDVVPINIPSVGLSQTKGAVAHCLWGSLLAMLGKYGLRADGTPAGGTLRIPGQINAQTEVQGLSRRSFMGRIPTNDVGAAEAARRMGLPDDAYRTAIRDTPRAALDYSDPAPVPELFVCFGTQFESNMPGRLRWKEKLTAPNVRFVAVDPIPDPFSLAHAELVLPAPPHIAAAKLYQNGEWRFTLSIPRKRAPRETRTDATIVYDAGAAVSRRLREDAALRARHADLAPHVDSGYLRERFESPETGGKLARIDGEVSRPQLWARVQAYMAGGSGPLYCRPEHADGRPIAWSELLAQGSLVSGGVGSTRYRLAYDEPEHVPFRDVFRRPRKFAFFVPTEKDLLLPQGIVLNSGRSTLSDDRARIRFAISTFNSGKATPSVDMPAENPLYVSPALAARLGLATGDRARVTNRETGGVLILPVVVSDRVKGDGAYVSFHKTRAEVDGGRYLNDLTSHVGRCPYTSQSNFKATVVELERAP